MAEREAHLVERAPDGLQEVLEILGPRLRSLPMDIDHYPALVEASRAQGLRLAMQHAVTGDLDLAVTSHGRAGALRSRRRFTEAVRREIQEVSAASGPDTLFAVDVRAEPALLASLPPQVRPAMARVLARPVVGLAAGSPPGTRFAVHLRLSGVRNLQVGSLRDLNPVVLLANAIAAGWQEDCPLDLVHLALVGPDQATAPDADYCRPLRQLHLPVTTRLSLGFADDGQPLEDQRGVRRVVEDSVGARVVVAARDGLGGLGTLRRIAELCES